MSSELSTVGSRLKEERERLGLSQIKMAELAGASKHSQIDWEADRSSPNARYLGSISTAGADVLYIITNERRSTSPAAFNPILLRHVVKDAEEALQASRIRMSPSKKADLIALLYDHFKGAETVERATVKRFLQLVA
jgi:transcriptional regulator with XRE-family HTH domain